MKLSHREQLVKRTSPRFPVFWSKSTLQHLEKYSNNPTESEKSAIAEYLEQKYPEAAPFPRKIIESELTGLRIGPQYNLWTGEMISWLISELRWEMKSCPPALSTIYHGFSTRYQRDIEFEEAYRMLQQLKLDERIAFNWDTRKWAIRRMMQHTSDKAQAASKLSHAFKPSTWFRAKEVHEPPKQKLQGIYWSGELLQRLVDLQEQHPNGTSDEERSQILKDLGQRFWRAHPECWQHVEMELEHLKKGTTEVLWNPDMEQRLAELFCRSRLFTLDAPKAVLYNEFGARLGRGEIYNKIQELKLVKRIQFDLILGGWTYPGMTKGWVGPDGAGEYGVP